MSGIGVVIGPGRFTSLRIGLACAKGLAVADNILIKGFNILDALLYSLPEEILKQEKVFIPAVDVRRNEIYYRTYQGLQPITNFCLSNPEQFAAAISENAFVFGSGINHFYETVKTFTDKNFSVYDMKYPDPCAIAFKTAQSIKQNDISELENLVPIYVR